MAVVALLVAVVLTSLVSTLAGAFALRLLGVGVPRIDLGAWGPKARFTVAGSDVSLSPWLVSGSSTFKDIGNADVYGNSPGKLLSGFGRWVRAAVPLIGPLSVLAAACLLAGHEALGAFGRGFAQIFLGALDPLDTAQVYLDAFRDLAGASPVASMGVALAKFAAFSMLPLPPLNGGQAIAELSRGRDAGFGPRMALVQQAGIFAVLIIIMAWLVAVGAWLARGGAI